MNNVLNFWILGGDLRQAYLARLLAEDGHLVHTYALDLASVVPSGLISGTTSALNQADVVILPMPVSSDEHSLFAPFSSDPVALTEILDAISPNSFLCGGRPDPSVLSLAHRCGLSILDYYAEEELILSNCIPTAEGAIQLAMEHLPITIHASRVLVIGCGRLGKITSERFAALGANVTVAARNYEQLAWAECHGLGTVRTDSLSDRLHQYDLILNTVPSLILGGVELSHLNPECLILDLASKPGGVDFEAANALHLSVIHALSLPGKVAPATAGAIIKQTICHMLHEHGF